MTKNVHLCLVILGVGVISQIANAQPSALDAGRLAFARRDFRTALTVLSPLAEQGVFDAQLMLGFMYSSGEGVGPDDIEAVKWWRRCAEQGYAPCQLELGGSYNGGMGVPRDKVAGAAWILKAAEQGDDMAMFTLAGLCLDGSGVQQDSVKAYMWFQLAIEKRSAWAGNAAHFTTKLTPAQLTEATKLAKECESRNFKNCGT
jgi:TPR repeat protein